MTFFLSRAISHGRTAGIVSLLGATTGVVIHTLLAAFGVSALLAASPTGFFILKIIGALYLLWLAFQAVRYGSTFTLETENTKPLDHMQNWLTGIGINLLNPKIVLFFITFLPQFISPEDQHAAQKMVFLGLYFTLFSTICSIIIILAVDQVSKTLKKNRKVTRVIDWIFAGVFGAFALRILLAERS